MSDHIERMKTEHSDLAEKILSLNRFICSDPIFKSLDDMEQVRMIKQVGFMEAYLGILGSRIWAAT